MAGDAEQGAAILRLVMKAPENWPRNATTLRTAPGPPARPHLQERSTMPLRTLVLAFAILLAPGFAAAQIYNRPSPEIIEDGQMQNPDAALVQRIERLERDLRRMTGRVEELQHKTQMLEEQLRAAPAAGVPGPAAHVESAPGRSSGPSGAVIVAAPPPATPSSPGRRGDAFDPAANPGAAGAPRQIGSTDPSAPLPAGRATPLREPGQPLDISRNLTGGATGAAGIEPQVVDAPAAPNVKDEFDRAAGPLRSGQYEAAEMALTAFLARNGKSKYAAAATFNLGESFFLRGRHREAAEKYLEISTKFPQSSSAPEAMLRLGQSLYALNRPDAREQACASFLDLGVKYPNAPNKVKEAATREARKLQC